MTAWGTNANSQLTNYFTTQAQITVVPAPGWLANVQFVSPESGQPRKYGRAATSMSDNDLWNPMHAGDHCMVTNLGASGNPVGVSVSGPTYGPDEYWDRSMAAFDDMYDHYLCREYGNIDITITNLSIGTYNIYLYGHGQNENENGSYSAKVGNNAWSDSKSTTNSGWDFLTPIWKEGRQYVIFPITIHSNEPVSVSVSPDGGPSILSGMQIAKTGDIATPPIVMSQIQDQEISLGASATLSVNVIGSAPLVYRWLHGTTLITNATGSSYTINNARAADSGSYTVIITNAYGSASNTATLTVDTPPISTMSVSVPNITIGSNHFTATIQGNSAVSMAILVNSTNFASATWGPFTNSVPVTLGSADGDYLVWFGFRGADGSEYWRAARITVARPFRWHLWLPRQATPRRRFFNWLGILRAKLVLLMT